MASKTVFDRTPYQPAGSEHGPFHRKQCPHVNELMCQSGLVGGDRSYGIGSRQVRAFTSPLPPFAGGIEFWTSVPPYPDAPPKMAYWNEAMPGVEPLDLPDRQIVAIRATIVKRVDDYAYCRDECKSKPPA